MQRYGTECVGVKTDNGPSGTELRAMGPCAGRA